MLGYQISVKVIISDPEKVIAIEVLEWSSIISKIRGFLGAVSFFQKYI